MHRALEIQEILVEIFSDFNPDEILGSRRQDLAVLARTCRSFKELASDRLWSNLDGCSPLARCLPDASESNHVQNEHSLLVNVFSFKRPLTQTEWNVLQNYTRRIRIIWFFHCGLDWVSVKTFLDPPTTKPLFPNLRKLHGKCTMDIPLLRFPLPSLVELSVTFSHLNPRPEFLESLPKTSPVIRTLSLNIDSDTPHGAFDSPASNFICRLKNLRDLNCSSIILDARALVHISHLPALTGQLVLHLGTESIPSHSLLVFPNQKHVSHSFASPEAMIRFLHQARFPAVTSFDAYVSDFPIKGPPLLAGLPTFNTTQTLRALRLEAYNEDTRFDDRARFGLADLQPCTFFTDLRRLNIDVGCYVDLTNSDILTLASAWAKLEYISINQEDGWRRHRDSGITPAGLVQLLQMCPSLAFICLLFNTQGYTEVPASHIPASLGLEFRAFVGINVIDSAIEDGSLTAITKFFHGIAACASTEFSFDYGLTMSDNDDYERWKKVASQLGCFRYQY